MEVGWILFGGEAMDEFLRPSEEFFGTTITGFELLEEERGKFALDCVHIDLSLPVVKKIKVEEEKKNVNPIIDEFVVVSDDHEVVDRRSILLYHRNQFKFNSNLERV
ncbi:hypothetical protein PIB30_080636 [Stylosanthes scabra]|uniref:Uncharacterized protein n=1 Tax=Stylosanthes scabra TaxID=79078 RepID=A0ABU6VSP3_9FABA|nr:hypothetical protein [Stylosanthes scabra]